MTPVAPDNDNRKGTAEGWRQRLGRVPDRLRAWWSSPAFRTSTTLVLIAIAIIGFLIFYVRPWGSLKEPSDADIARAWSEQIARLGVIPVFPPQEDFHVGDIWAVIARAESVPLQGKAVRIGHIDLRSEILRANGAPRFAETSLADDGTPAFIQPSQEEKANEDSAGLINLSRVAFPTIILHHGASSSAGFAFQPAAIGGRRSDIVSDEVRIPNAVTYGAPAAEAGAHLIGWCRNEATSGYCTDGALRKILAYAVSSRVQDKRDDGTFSAAIQLRLITQVYMTREIQVRRLLDGDGGVEVQAAAGSGSQLSADRPEEGTGSDASGQPDVDPNDTTVAQNLARAEQIPSNRTGTARASGSFAERQDVGLDTVFPRPVVIGYKAITIEIPKEAPEGE